MQSQRKSSTNETMITIFGGVLKEEVVLIGMYDSYNIHVKQRHNR